MLRFNCEIMTNLMMDLLDLAQLENNSFKLNKVFFSLTDACKQAIQVVGHNASLKNVEIEGPSTDSCTDLETELLEQIYGDRNRMVQVIINFISNSIKFSLRDSKIKIKFEVLECQKI